jgi:TonB family protein
VWIEKTGDDVMRLSVASAALAAAFVLAPVAVGHAPALSQDFSITNQMEPANAGRRDVMRQLQAWWDVHAYYPRHASQNDEAGTVKVRLVIHPDGRIWTVDVVEGSGSGSLDTAGVAAFRGGFVRPFPADAPEANIDISLHYVLAHRHDQPVAAGDTPVSSRSPFTVMNDPVRSPILDTMLQRTCTGTVVKEGVRNHPMYGGSTSAQAIFFRRSNGTPWVKFYEDGYPILAPVTEVGKLVQWTGREEHLNRFETRFIHYTVWPDGDNKLSGNIYITYAGPTYESYRSINQGGTVDLACATETVPAITWSAFAVTPGPSPPGDPP